MPVINTVPSIVDNLSFSRASVSNKGENYGPFQYNGKLYTIFGGTTATYPSNRSKVYSSTDGNTWTELDAANSIISSNSNYAVSYYPGNTSFYFWYTEAVTGNVKIGGFNLATETYILAGLPASQAAFSGNTISISALSNNDIVLSYQKFDGTVNTIYYRKYTAGAWGAETLIATLNPTSGLILESVYRDSIDTIHYIVRNATGQVYYYNSLTVSGTVGTKQIIKSGTFVYVNNFIKYNNTIVIPYNNSVTGTLGVLVGSPAVNPSSWTDTDTGFTCWNGTNSTDIIGPFPIIDTDGTLILFYQKHTGNVTGGATVDSISYTTTLNGTTFTAPVLYFDSIANPSSYLTNSGWSNIHNLSGSGNSLGIYHLLFNLDISTGQCTGFSLPNAAAGTPLSTLVTDSYSISDAVALRNSIAVSASDTHPGFTDFNYPVLYVTSSTGGTIVGAGCPGGGVLIGDQAFEFYGLLKPETVEILPVAKRFDQVGPVRFDKLGKLLAIRIRVITSETNLNLRVQTDSQTTLPNMQGQSGDYVIGITTVPLVDDVYEVKIPKTIKGTVFRFEIGPNCGIFYRYDLEIKVQVSGMQADPKWQKVG